MTVYVIELTDADIKVAKEGEVVLHSPGYALINKHQVEVGEEAFNQARLHPRRAHNQFWHRLSLDPLTHATSHYRHHADLVYAHLKYIASKLDAAAEVVFVVPGNYSKDQLSLLLGVAQESSLQVVGLVDVAVATAAACALRNPTFYLDILLHQATLTRLDVDTNIRRNAVDSTENISLIKLYDQWVQLVADTFIDQCRFDPLHNAETEQALYSQLPEWLTAVAGQDEVMLELLSSGKRFEARLLQSRVIEQGRPFFRHLAKMLQSMSGDGSQAHLLLSERLARLPGITELIPAYQLVHETDFYQGCVQHLDFIRRDGQSFNFITALPVTTVNKFVTEDTALTKPADTSTMPATHLLIGNQVYRIDKPLYLGITSKVNEILLLSHDPSELTTLYCAIAREGGQLSVAIYDGAAVTVNGQQREGSTRLNTGDELVAGSGINTLRVISEV